MGTSTTLTLGTQSWTTAYGYASGNLASVAYPSGRVISYTRDAAGRIASVTSSQAGVTTALLSNITYVPFGAVQGWEFGAPGSGRSVQRSYDLNGRLTSVTMPSGSRQYTYDEDDRIVGIQDAVLGSAVYGYDDLSRLTSASTALGTWSYAYDANGNRTSLTSGGTAYPVTVETSSNRTTGITGPVAQAITFTADGQTASVTGGSSASSCTGPFTLGYTADGQLTTSSVMSVVNSVDGRRLQKNAAACAGGATTTFIHDEAGRLIATYDGSGALIEEIVWLGNLPVAVFKPSTPTTPYWVYADNLGSPRAITTATGQLVWRWDGEPFGNTPANENPSGLGSFSFNLRFPGQYFDAETGYHHNGWREYDPAQGRYVQADPAGFVDYTGVYVYVLNNPLSFIDWQGLFCGCAYANRLYAKAEVKSKGSCATYVRKALEAGGANTTNNPVFAKNYRELLLRNGFVEVSLENYKPEIGDTAVFNSFPTGSEAGHIQGYAGKGLSGWISDFNQPDFWANRGYKAAADYKIYRPPTSSPQSKEPCSCN